MREALNVVTALAVAAAVWAGRPAHAAVPESTDPILIVENNWTSQLVLAKVVGQPQHQKKKTKRSFRFDRGGGPNQ